MIIRRLAIALLSLVGETTSTTIISLLELSRRMNQLSFNDNALVKVETNVQPGQTISPKPSLLFTELIEHGEELKRETEGRDIKTVARKINDKLSKILASGIPLQNITPIIRCFFPNTKELAIAAQKVHAHTLLKLLQIIYLWYDEAQFHWFQALSYRETWCDDVLWHTRTMDWRGNLEAICELDQSALLARAQKDILSSSDLEHFDDKLLILCARHDAIQVFKASNFRPSRLKPHFNTLVANLSVKLLKLYKSDKKDMNLHLEKFPLSSKTPASVDDFIFLLRNGHDCFRMDQFIENFCKEGRLDLLKHLHRVEPKLVPNQRALEVAVDSGWIDIIKWAHKLGLFKDFNGNVAARLIIHDRLYAFLQWMDINKMALDKWAIKEVVAKGNLGLLEWINKRQPTKHGEQLWSDCAAEKCHLPILAWLYGKFNLLPSVKSLRNATEPILEWVRSKDSTMINAELVEYGAGNLELLRWALQNVPFSYFEEKKAMLAKGVNSDRMMIWFQVNIDVCPSSMDWAYIADNLEAIDWAMNEYQIFPTTENVCLAAERGYLDVIEWAHQRKVGKLDFSKIFKTAVEAGHTGIAHYILQNSTALYVSALQINRNIDPSKRLDILQWAYSHKLTIPFFGELKMAVSNGHVETLVWLTRVFPYFKISPTFGWKSALENGNHKVYKWLLERNPKRGHDGGLREDIQKAFDLGHLEIIKILLTKDPLLLKEISHRKVTRESFHVSKWLLVTHKCLRKKHL